MKAKIETVPLEALAEFPSLDGIRPGDLITATLENGEELRGTFKGVESFTGVHYVSVYCLYENPSPTLGEGYTRNFPVDFAVGIERVA